MLRLPHQGHYSALRLIEDPPDGVYLDVGANHGQSIDSIRLYKRNPLISIEPNPLLAAELKIRYPDVDVRGYALGRSAGEFTLYIPAYGKTLFEPRASLRREVAQSFLERRPVFGFDSRYAHIEKVLCEVRTLDSLNLAPALMKLDVEGLEEDVIEGGIDTIRDCRPIIMVERLTDAITERLAPLGYRACGYVHGRLVQAATIIGDTFLVPHDKARLIRKLDWSG